MSATMSQHSMMPHNAGVSATGSSVEPGVSAMSVGALVRQWLHPSDDPWHLALVQRDRVWNQLRVARLLDSLLAGYPIGTLLLCRIRQDGHALDHTRWPIAAPAGTWQLVDGQQRIGAMVALFADQPESERYFLDMVGQRWWDESVVTETKGRAQAISYIHWRLTDHETDTWNKLDGRSQLLRLAGFYKWAETGDAVVANALQQLHDAIVEPVDGDRLRQALQFLTSIDEKFILDASAAQGQLLQIAKRAMRLLDVWHRSVPIQRSELESEQDILQVFERLNLEGVRVSGEDVFFAAIKTRWHDAEPNLLRVTEAAPILGRISALRLLSRLAALADGQGDLIPLRVDRLNGPRGEAIRVRLRALCEPNGLVLDRLQKVATALVERSGLGYALRSVSSTLFDPVPAWAAVSKRTLDLSDEELTDIAGFVLGAALFRYPQVYDDAWARLTFQVALEAGINDAPFPVTEILTSTQSRWPNSKVGNRVIPRLDSDEDKLARIKANSTLLLSIVQRLPFQLPARLRGGKAIDGDPQCQVEWDHIWPANQQRRMKLGRGLVKGSDRVHHTGNFWALDRPLNNYLRDKPPSAKFTFLADPIKVAHMPDRWPTEAYGFLSPEERSQFESVQVALYQKAPSDDEVVKASREFAALVDARGLRIWSAVVERYPRVLEFAPSAAVGVEEQGSGIAGVDVARVADRLSLPRPSVGGHFPQPPAAANKLGQAIAIANDIDLANDLRRILAAVKEAGFRAVGCRPPRDPVRRWVKVGVRQSRYRRACLFWIVPEPSRRVIRIKHVDDNLRWLLGLSAGRTQSMFGSQRNRDYAKGEADIFVNETLHQLGAHLAQLSAVPAPTHDDTM